VKICQEQQQRPLKRKGSGTLVKDGVIPPTKEVYRSPGRRDADYIRKTIRALPERERRNYIVYCQFSTRLPGGHVENCRPPKRLSQICCRTRYLLSETTRTIHCDY